MKERIIEPQFTAYVVNAADGLKEAKRKFKEARAKHRSNENEDNAETLTELNNALAEYMRASKKCKRALEGTQLNLSLL